MKTAIMQPYLFPYIGYFQLIEAVDTFVIYDDVQYISRGWINRNRIMQNGQENLFTFSLEQDSSRKDINERYFSGRFERESQKLLKTLQFAYGRAPHFDQTKNLVENIFKKMDPHNLDENIAIKIGRSLRMIADFLELDTHFVMSSNIQKKAAKSGQQLILEITRVLGTDTYINPINGKKLYDHKIFQGEGIELFFLQPQKKAYAQFSDEFIPWLSIIDVCMFNSKDEIKELLQSYVLIK